MFQLKKRAADYLQAAAMTAPLLGTGIGTPACETYNAACGELTVLLRSSEGGQLWNQPMTFAANSTAYHLRFEPATICSLGAELLRHICAADQIKEKLIRKENIHEGIGGALVGVRKVNPPEKVRAIEGDHSTGHSHPRFPRKRCDARAASSGKATEWQLFKEKCVLWLRISRRH